MRTRTVQGIAEMAYRYNDYLLSYAQRYAQSVEDARDIVQDAYLMIMQSGMAPSDVNADTFCGYLRKLVFWRYKDYYRRGRLVTTDDTEEWAQEPPRGKEDTEFMGEVKRRALMAVPQACRETISMYLDGLTFEQIATRQRRPTTEQNERIRVRKYLPAFTARARRLATAGV